ncbi:MAG: hypothetical protein AB7W16_17030 [Candidatus Obscuribacterales bacterium]
MAGLDVAIMDLGRAIHTGSKRAAPTARRKRTLGDSGPIELGEGGKKDRDDEDYEEIDEDSVEEAEI